MSIQVSPLSEHDRSEWESFVDRQESATFFHRAGWKTVLERAFGHRTHYLMARQDGRVVGILPLAELRSRVFGHHLISTPFCVYGGAVAASDEAFTALVEYARQLANDTGVDDLELRHRGERRTQWPTRELYVTFRKTIEPDPDLNMKAIPRKQRAMVRKGIDAGLRAETESGTERIYRIYSESVRNLGTPVFSKHYFETLREVFADECEVSVVVHDGVDIAGVMSFYFRDEVLPYYGGSTTAARSLKANDFMYWDLMSRAAARGVRWFDFGRSKRDTGPYHFKKNWGFEPTPLSYEHCLVRAESIPSVDPTNPRYRIPIAVWKRLPLWLANGVGPLVARSLG